MQKSLQAAPTLFYQESDGKPMAETDRHRQLMINTIQRLEKKYENDQDVYVSGNLLIYYKEGDPKKTISPDVFVAFGVPKKLRNTYLVWEEVNTPDFVLEVASPSTFDNDLGWKKEVYASVLCVKEYFIYDPLGQTVPSFIGYRLIDDRYQEIEVVSDRIPSQVLGLQLGEHEGDLGFYNPAISEWLRTPEEEVKVIREIAQQETIARQNAEKELAKALAEIERLRTGEVN